MSRYRTSESVSDYMLVGLVRSGLWSYLWHLRLGGMGGDDLVKVVHRWEKLTGRRYHGGQD